MSKMVFASVISEIQQSKVFMTVKARICEAPMANLNGARVTEAFIDDVVGNQERYVGLPLYADVKALTSGKYRQLGHLYDSKTGEFHSTQIGSFYQFEKEEIEGGYALIGYARIAKRNNKLSKAISELFADGALKFSFEVAVGEYEELDDGTILIDASESNYLEGTAIVTFPACEEAVALQLVAQQADDAERGVKEMADNKVTETAEVEETNTAVEQPVQAEAHEEPSEVNAEENKANETASEETKEEAEEEKAEADNANENAAVVTDPEANTEEAECKKEKQKGETAETAAVFVREAHKEKFETEAFDTETETSVSQTIEVETVTNHVDKEASLVDTDQGTRIAEEEGSDSEGTDTQSGEDGAETPAEGAEPTEEPVPAAEEPALPGENEKKTAEQLVAELAAVVEGLKSEIAELKKSQAVVAEKKTVTAEINPFIDPISASGMGYSLLQKDDNKPITSYSLLGKA